MRHHPCGFSRLYLRAECPASLCEEHTLPDTPSDDAERGRRLHKAVETRNLDGLGQFEAVLVSRCLDEIEALKAWAEEQGYQITQEIHERYVHVTAEKRREVSGGTPDTVLIATPTGSETPTGAVLIDWKFHYGDTPSDGELNWQMSGQAAGVFQTYGDLRVIRALAYHAPTGQVIFERTYHREALEDIIATIRDVHDAAYEPSPRYSPGAHCARCRAASRCLKADSWAQRALIRATNGERPISRGQGGVVIHDEKLVASWLSRVRSAIKVLEAAAKETEEMIFDAATDGHEWTSVRFQSTGESPKVSNWEKALDELPEDIREAALGARRPTMGDLEDAVRKIEGVKGQKAKDRVRELLGENLLLQPKRPSIRIV